MAREPVSEALHNLCRGHRASQVRQRHEGSGDDLAPRLAQPHPPEAMSLGIGPKIASEGAYSVGNLRGRKRGQLVGKLLSYDQPRRFRASICVNEGII